MNSVNFFNQTNNKIVEVKELEALIKYAICRENVDGVEFSIIFVNNTEMLKLNQTYRNIDKVTDVLSFALNTDFSDIIDNYKMLGDIYISIDKAKEQANEYGHSLLRELSFLMVHGFLHLLGYDHMNNKDEEKMFLRQEEILDEFNIKR